MQPLHATDLHRQRHPINIAEHQPRDTQTRASALQSVLYGKIFRRNFSPPFKPIHQRRKRTEAIRYGFTKLLHVFTAAAAAAADAAAPSLPATRSCCSCCCPWCWQFQRCWLAHLAATISSVYTSMGLIRRMRLINSLAEHNWSSVSDYTTEAVSQTTTGAAVYTSNTFSAPGTLLYSRK